MSGTKSNNLAARMGRWSADHWKTATFGWLAFVLVAVALGGMSGQKTLDPNAAGPGQSGRMDTILDEGFKQPAGESVLVQSSSLTTADAVFTGAIQDVVARVSKLADVQNVRSPLDQANSGQISPSGHAALVEFDIRGPKEDAADKVGPVLDQVDAAQQAHPAVLHRGVRRRQRRQADRGRVWCRPRQGGDAVASRHADHPRARLRRTRRSGHPVDPRADGRVRDLRSRLPDEPRGARGDAGAGGRPPDRARGRRRLLALLPAPRARGTGHRTRQPGRHRDRSRDLGPGGAGLRPDRHDRHGRHVPDR